MTLAELPNQKLETVKAAQPRRDCVKIGKLVRNSQEDGSSRWEDETLVASLGVPSGSRSFLLSYSVDTWNLTGPCSPLWPEQWGYSQVEALENLPYTPDESRPDHTQALLLPTTGPLHVLFPLPGYACVVGPPVL